MSTKGENYKRDELKNEKKKKVEIEKGEKKKRK
jgi:hypothetical protein